MDKVNPLSNELKSVYTYKDTSNVTEFKTPVKKAIDEIQITNLLA